jgi:hypothetical protein
MKHLKAKRTRFFAAAKNAAAQNDMKGIRDSSLAWALLRSSD